MGACRLHRIGAAFAAVQILFLREQHRQMVVLQQILRGKVEIRQQIVDVAGGGAVAFAVRHRYDVHHRETGQIGEGGICTEGGIFWAMLVWGKKTIDLLYILSI